jgi:DNA-binding CsgD family transcriptional regulator
MANKARVRGSLTPMEDAVLQLIGQGKTSKEIAVLLGMSVLTVGNHRKNLARKLNLHSTAQLASHGAMAGLNSEADTACTVTLNLVIDDVSVEMTYSGGLKSSGGRAKVSIGKSSFRF